MAGGIGSRFWPYSRKKHPKQFLDILGTGSTMLQQTAERFASICPPENIFVVTNEQYTELTAKQLPELKKHQILSEPLMRNTAPCIAYACLKIAQRNPKANIVVSPADHLILKESLFTKTVNKALEYTEKNDILVTLGIKPSRPDTGYGYIQADEQDRLGPLHKVRTFTEKPNAQLAKTFVESGEFLWNAGLFIWNVRTILHNLRQHLPDIYSPLAEISSSYYTNKEAEAIRGAYYQCRNISIDYGLLEKANQVYVLPSEFGWSDLGTWKSLFEQAEKDGSKNVVQGKVMVQNTKNSIIKADKKRLVVVEGLDNMIVVDHTNVLLICSKDNEQQIKTYLKQVEQQHGEKFV